MNGWMDCWINDWINWWMAHWLNGWMGRRIMDGSKERWMDGRWLPDLIKDGTTCGGHQWLCWWVEWKVSVSEKVIDQKCSRPSRLVSNSTLQVWMLPNLLYNYYYQLCHLIFELYKWHWDFRLDDLEKTCIKIKMRSVSREIMVTWLIWLWPLF